jgi:hypothetical protein
MPNSQSATDRIHIRRPSRATLRDDRHNEFRRRDVERRIVDGGGDYVLAVKENQSKSRAAKVEHFATLQKTDIADYEDRPPCLTAAARRLILGTVVEHPDSNN